MKTIGRLTIAITIILVIAAIWSPWHWQMAATAVLALVAGAAILGDSDAA